MTAEDRADRKEKPIVLVIDNDMVRRFRTTVYLLRLEYPVFPVATAEDALRIMELTVPLIVITDINLPGMNGQEFLKKMKQDPQIRHVPVLIYTMTENPVDRKLCEVAGCAGYVTQTSDHNALFDAVQKATEPMPRHVVRLKTWLDVSVDTKGHEMSALVTAISEQGMFVSTPNPLPVNTTVVFTIHLSKMAAGVKVTGQVLFTQANEKGKVPGMAIKFRQITPDAARLIKTFVEEKHLEGVASSNRK
jgi:CheY-like chemotaxis protein/Tfp pilus assembly protein PilZ